MGTSRLTEFLRFGILHGNIATVWVPVALCWAWEHYDCQNISYRFESAWEQYDCRTLSYSSTSRMGTVRRPGLFFDSAQYMHCECRAYATREHCNYRGCPYCIYIILLPKWSPCTIDWLCALLYELYCVLCWIRSVLFSCVIGVSGCLSKISAGILCYSYQWQTVCVDRLLFAGHDLLCYSYLVGWSVLSSWSHSCASSSFSVATVLFVPG